MADISKTITYKVPNERFGTDDSGGKTSTHTYVGPAKLMLYMDTGKNMVKETFDFDNQSEQPTPADFYELELDCEASDENCIRCALIGPAGYDTPKVYEVGVGPADQPNMVVKDPTHISEVYDKNSVVHGYNGSSWENLTYETGPGGDDYPDNSHGRANWDWDFVRSNRNDQLTSSDAATSEDMPADMKADWANFRQQLRDLPADWAGVPVDLVVMPTAPDEADQSTFADPAVPVVMIADRTAEDDAIVAQLPNNVN
jgi:hypothetical protein